MAGPRLANDPDRYIRLVKGKQFQARPFDEGQRYDLGLFRTIGEAQKAIREFWWGKREQVPRFTRRINARFGARYLALRPGRGKGVLGLFSTRDAAALCVVLHVVVESHRQAEREQIERPPDPADPPDRDVLAVVEDRACALVAELMVRRDGTDRAKVKERNRRRAEAQAAELAPFRAAIAAEKAAARMAKFAREYAEQTARYQARIAAGRKGGKVPATPEEREQRYQAQLVRNRAKKKAKAAAAEVAG